MTENEFWSLPVEQRRTISQDAVDAALLTTHQEAHDLLALEGWEFVGMDDRLKDEPDYDPEEDSEVWRREVGGKTEWCEVFKWPLLESDLTSEQCWYRGFTRIDPRLIEIE